MLRKDSKDLEDTDANELPFILGASAFLEAASSGDDLDEIDEFGSTGGLMEIL